MTGVVSISTLVPTVIMGLAGTAFGLAYFTALRRTVDLIGAFLGFLVARAIAVRPARRGG